MNANEPNLAPPGAGLPTAELVVARIMFARRLKKGSRESFVEAFQREKEKIRALIRDRDTELLGKRALIERVRGLEDSSRFWSVWMTLEHLRIVHAGIARTISDLGADKTPPGKVSTAAVKPSASVTSAVLPEFEKSCDNLLDAAATVPNLKTKLRHEHPWFGPLDAFGWLALAAGHIAIHREQIERILAALNRINVSSLEPA
jgi:hypothetical protein